MAKYRGLFSLIVFLVWLHSLWFYGYGLHQLLITFLLLSDRMTYWSGWSFMGNLKKRKLLQCFSGAFVSFFAQIIACAISLHVPRERIRGWRSNLYLLHCQECKHWLLAVRSFVIHRGLWKHSPLRPRAKTAEVKCSLIWLFGCTTRKDDVYSFMACLFVCFLCVGWQRWICIIGSRLLNDCQWLCNFPVLQD